MSQKYHLAICELFNRSVHGIVENVSSKDVETHYLVNETILPSDIIFNYLDPDDQNLDNLANYVDWRVQRFQSLHPDACHHKYIRNYSNIMTDENIHLPKIVKMITLPGGERVALIKMFWLKCIQRKWREVVRQRNNILQQRTQNNALLYRELHHTWPEDCRTLPSLKGMLHRYR